LATAHDAERDGWPAPAADSSGGAEDDMAGYVQSWEINKSNLVMSLRLDRFELLIGGSGIYLPSAKL
jgi:hypothetical protein